MKQLVRPLVPSSKWISVRARFRARGMVRDRVRVLT